MSTSETEIQGVIVNPDDHKGDSNYGKWDVWYKDLQIGGEHKRKYGGEFTYVIAAAYLSDCKEVEDWGCGRGAFRNYCIAPYVGVDGSHTPYADKVVELASYRSEPEGILLRHVLEHNYRWPDVLEAALQSFRRKLCLVLFTPFADTTRELRHNRKSGVDVPDLSLSAAELEGHFERHGLKWRLYPNLQTKTQYGVEHVYLVWRP